MAPRSDASTGPGVRFPPPLAFVAGWIGAWLLHRVLPFSFDGDGASPTQVVVGVLLLVAGLSLTAWAIATFLRARTSVVPTHTARVLVDDGPFRFSRNPMYVGLTAAYCGLAVVLNMVWPFLVLPGVLALLVLAVIRREERHLLARFGDDYRAYQRRVRRWL
jgi:protein-S-isoprenylcysteine O-methyltransferase Ste14